MKTIINLIPPIKAALLVVALKNIYEQLLKKRNTILFWFNIKKRTINGKITLIIYQTLRRRKKLWKNGKNKQNILS